MEDRDIEPLLARMDTLIRRVPCEFTRFISPRINWNLRLIGKIPLWLFGFLY